ncbi:MAG: hypothetical protein V4727_09530 [Verrucomicrobiota bacterium]
MKILHQFALLTFLFFHNAYGAPDRTCRIVFLERPANAPKSLHLFDGSASQEVELPSMNLSPVYKIASGAIQLKLLDTKVDDPKAVSPDAPTVNVPEDYSDFFLLVTSDPENKKIPVKLQAIKLDSENFKLGQTLWTNHSDKIIEGKLGTQILSIKPENSQIVDTPFTDKSTPTSGYYSASFTYQVEGKTTFSPITEQQWWHDAKSRHLGFIANTGGKLPKIYFFRDFRE